MKITFLGTGTSHGVPMIGCECEVCSSTDSANQRLRSSILVESGGFHLVVDTTPDLRAQCLRAKIRDLDAILYTHEHSDHVLGLDELRRFCMLHDKRLPAYGSERVLHCIERIFPYAVSAPPPYKGLPELNLHKIDGPFSLGPWRLYPFRMPHGKTESMGFRFDKDGTPRFAYLTDCKMVPAAVRKGIHKIPLLILGVLREKPHPTHLSVSEALEVIGEIHPARTLFTHLCHEMDHHIMNAKLPPGVALARDEQVVEA